MKKFFTLILLLCAVIVHSQSSPANISFNKQDKYGLMLTLPYKETVAEGAILENLKKTGYDVETKGKFFWKQNTINGFHTFKNVNLNNNLVDLYFKVDQKRKRSEESTIYLLVSKGEENFISSADTDVYEAAREFLDGFITHTAVHKLNLDIEVQENAVKDAEKKFTRLKDDEKDMEKKIERLQDDLKKNREQQGNQEKLIELEKKKLEDLKTRATAG